MTPRDYSQVPVEQLASLLLERARLDPHLPRRTPANSNQPPVGWNPPRPAEPCRAWLPARLAPPPPLPGQERIAELVSQAIASAQEAEDLARATQAASRRATRGAAVAIVLGLLGVVVGTTAGLSGVIGHRSAHRMQAAAEPAAPARVAGPVQSVAQSAPARSRAEEAVPTPALPSLAPATYVRVLPAVEAQPPPVLGTPATRPAWQPTPPQTRPPLPQRRSS